MTADPPPGSPAPDADLFRLFAENVVDYAVFVIDVDRTVRTWSPAAERLLGYTVAEILGESADRFFTSEDLASGRPEQEVQQALATGRGDDDRWHVRKDGSRFWSAGVLTPLRHEDGRVRGFAKIMRDQTDLKRAAEASADAVAYAESIVATVREPLVVLDAELRVRTANRSFYRTFGVSPEETEGLRIYDLGNRQWDISELRRLLEEVLPQNTSFDDFHVEHEFEDIGRRSMRLNARKVYRPGNHSELILLAIEDVTERRQAEAERRAIETRFTSLVKNIKDHSIFTLSPEGKVTSWNIEAERILGYSEAEAVGLDFPVIFTPEDIESGTPDWELRTAREHGRAEDERWHVKKTGERFWALGIVTPMYDRDGALLGYSKILRDMSDRKAADDRSRFQAHLLDAVGQAVIATDPGGTVLYWNRSAESLYGWSKEEAVGRRVDDLVVAPEAAVASAEIMDRLAAGAGWSGEFLVRRKDGTTFPAFVTNAPIFGESGDLEAIVGVSADVTERKRAEETARGNEERLRALTDNLPDGAIYQVVQDADGTRRFTFASAGIERLFGVSPEQAIADPAALYGTIHVDDRDRVLSTETESLRTLTRFGCEFRHRMPGGEVRWVHARSAPRRLPGGGIVWEGVLTDATDRRRAQEGRRASEERFRAIAEKSVTGIAEIDLSGRFVYVNDRYCETVGQAREVLLGGMQMLDVTHPDDRSANLPPLERLVRDGTPFTIEKRYVRPDGTAVWVSNSVSAVRDADGHVKSIVAVTVDVTDRRAADERLRRLAGQFRSLAAASATINASLSKASVLRVVTEEARHVVGTHQAVSSLTENERRTQAINTISLSEKYADYRVYAREPDGSGIYTLVCRTNRPMRLTQAELVSHPAWKRFGGDAGHPPMRGWLAAPLIARDGRNIGLVQLSDKEDGGDFTEEDEAILVQLAQTASVALENARLYDELRDADRRKDEFLAMLAHELRNPLAPIRSGLDLLKLECGDSEVVEIMGEQVGHVVRLVDDLLDVSRILRGKVELRREQTDLAAVLRRAVETIRPRSEEHRQRLAVSLPQESVPLDADPVRLTQVFANLLGNASKYTDDGGEVRLEACREGGEAVIRVSDTGIGIEPALLPKVFDLFTQAEQALDRSQGGLGSGLRSSRASSRCTVARSWSTARASAGALPSRSVCL